MAVRIIARANSVLTRVAKRLLLAFWQSNLVFEHTRTLPIGNQRGRTRLPHNLAKAPFVNGEGL